MVHPYIPHVGFQHTNDEVTLCCFSFQLLTSAGFVNPGCVLPPIADPQFYYIFDKAHLQNQLTEVRQRGTFIGGRIYAACLLQVLEQWSLPRRLISTLYNTFTSTKYQQRLFDKWDELKFLLPNQKLKSSAETIKVSLYAHF